MTDEKRLPFMRFYWSDWRADPALRMCSLSARGLWAEMIGLMHEADPYGHLLVKGRPITAKQLAALVGATERQVKELLAELKANEVYSVDDSGVIFSRRMIRDFDQHARAKHIGTMGGNPELARGTVEKSKRHRPFKRTDAPAKTQRIFERSGGRCHWCNVALQSDSPGPDFFQVDHVVAIRDGGNNDESNLVAACSKCNHERARKGHKIKPFSNSDNNTDRNSDSNSDHKPQSPESRVQSSSERNDRPNAGANLERLASILKLDHKAFHRHPKFARFPAFMAEWVEAGADPELDVWPTIIKLAKRSGNITSPAFFDSAIREAIALRQATQPIVTADRWRQRLTHYVRRGVWDVAEWGPKPNEPGCKAPAELVAEIVNGAQEATH